MQPESKVSLDTIISTIRTYSAKARTDDERSLLHRLTTDLANRIRQTDDKNFNQGEFLRACNVNPEWGKLQAAA